MTKTFEIRKAGFTNKGAAMMLIAATQEIRARLPDARVVVAPNYTLPFDSRARLGLWHRAELVKGPVDFGRAVELLPRKLRERYGFVTQAEVDVIFDAAGFAYSDQWGSPAAEDLARRSRNWKQQGKTLILLPQAFGPFEKQGMADAMNIVADNAALIFARDQQSYDHLTGIVGARDTIRMAPDFTNMLKGTPGGPTASGPDPVAVVPNARMLDMTSSEQSGGYEAFLAAAIRKVQAAGLAPFFLIHETTQDLAVAKRINETLATPIEIIEVDDPLEAKYLIGQCAAMIGSRFHAIVSALSQAIPVIGTGWSHKYRELFGDYDYPEGLTQTTSGDAEFDTILAPIVDASGRERISAGLATAGLRLKTSVAQMWDDVFRHVGAQ